MNEEMKQKKEALNAKAEELRARANKTNEPNMRRRLFAAAVTMETQSMHLGETPSLA